MLGAATGEQENNGVIARGMEDEKEEEEKEEEKEVKEEEEEEDRKGSGPDSGLTSGFRWAFGTIRVPSRRVFSPVHRDPA